MAIDRALQQVAAPGAAGELPPLFRRFQLWTLIFFFASVAFHLFQFYVLHHEGHSVFPYSLTDHDRFYDFTIFTDKFRYIHTARFFDVGFPINYPAPVALAFNVFFRYAAPHQVFAFVTVCVLAFLIPALLFGAALVRRGIQPARAYTFCVVLCLFSWPVQLIVDGANAEVFVWLAMLLAMFFLVTEHGYLAAVFFGLAAALKLFPIIFLALFLRRGQFGKLLTGIASFLLISVASLKALGPSVSTAYHGISFGLESFKRNYMARWKIGENGVDHSLFATLKMLLYYVFHHDRDDFTGWLRGYLLLTAVGGVLLYVLLIRKTPLLNQVLLLSVASIYFTAFSGDGTLIHLYYPLAFLLFLSLAAWRQNVRVPGLTTAVTCILFCVSVESFFVVSHFPTPVRYIGPMHAIALGILFVTGLRFPFGPPVSGDRQDWLLAHPSLTWLSVPGARRATHTSIESDRTA